MLVHDIENEVREEVARQFSRNRDLFPSGDQKGKEIIRIAGEVYSKLFNEMESVGGLSGAVAKITDKILKGEGLFVPSSQIQAEISRHNIRTQQAKDSENR